jgi:hypothetical protein
MIRGTNFGPVGFATAIDAVYFPTSIPRQWVALSSRLQFHAANCAVVEDNVAMTCANVGGFGGSISWRISIEGLGSSIPLSSYDSPDIDNATLLTVTNP